MASKKVLIDSFYQQFSSFLNELAEMYPRDSEFPMFNTYLTMIKVGNPKLAVSYMNANVSVYMDKIMSRDESFFMDKSFDEYQGHFNMSIIPKLKSYIGKMSPESKKNVWQYIENISRLAAAIDS
jgi:hypothetical protein